MINHINDLGQLIRDGIDLAFERAKIKGMSTGICSLAWPHFNADNVRDYRSSAKGNFNAMALVHLDLISKGIYMAARGGEISISTAMAEKEVHSFLEAFEESLADVREYIEQTTPELII